MSMSAADMKLAENALKAIYHQFDWSGTRLHDLQQTVGERAVQAALCADLLEQRGIWLSVTQKGAEVYQEKLRPKPRPRKLPRDLDYEEVLIRARVAVELLEECQPSNIPLAARVHLRRIASVLSRPFDTVPVPERYQAESDELRKQLLKLS